MHGASSHFARAEGVDAVKRDMSRPKAHFSLVVRNHVTGARLKVELIDLPFLEGRQFRLRVNGQWGPQGARGERNRGPERGAELAGEAGPGVGCRLRMGEKRTVVSVSMKGVASLRG